MTRGLISKCDHNGWTIFNAIIRTRHVVLVGIFCNWGWAWFCGRLTWTKTGQLNGIWLSLSDDTFSIFDYLLYKIIFSKTFKRFSYFNLSQYFFGQKEVSLDRSVDSFTSSTSFKCSSRIFEPFSNSFKSILICFSLHEFLHSVIYNFVLKIKLW